MEPKKDKKKKPQISKAYSLCFPFNFEYKVITGEQSIAYLLKRMELIYTHNTQTKKSIKFGLNTAINLIENYTLNEPLCIFIFYDHNPNTKSQISFLINLMMVKLKEKQQIKMYLIDKEYQKDFIKLYKLKKVLCFSLLYNEHNSKVITEITNNFMLYNSNTSALTPVYMNTVKETIVERNVDN